MKIIIISVQEDFYQKILFIDDHLVKKNQFSYLFGHLIAKV